MNRRTWPAVIGLAVVVLAACAAPTQPTTPMTSVQDAVRSMTVYRSPDCSCCHLWADFARDAGWTIATVDKLDMAAFKAEAGVPDGAASCHTAMIDGYFVEGHVPMAAIERLLAERPAIDGIALPGMPAGSPGMSGQLVGPLDVLAVSDGELSLFGSY